MEAIEKVVKPPMIAPSMMEHTTTSILPGDITYADTDGTRGEFRPVFQVDPKINDLEQKQQQVRDRIQRAFYVDLFLMLARSDRRQITAREIEERHEEKLIGLGPVLEQIDQDMLDPLIDITFQIAWRQGRIPPPPPELEGVDLKVEYISIMAQAQKLVGVASIERGTRFIMDLSSSKQDPGVWDKYDDDKAIDAYFNAIGTPAEMIRSDDAVQEIRQARIEAEQERQRREQAKEMVSAAKDLSGTDLEKDNALKRLLSQANAGQLTP
jgi:hypothetical protein